MFPALIFGFACSDSASVFSVTGEHVAQYPGLLLLVESPEAVLQAQTIDPGALPLVLTLPENASSARLVLFEDSTGELFGDVSMLEHQSEGEPLPAGALELEVELGVDGDGTWRERERSAVLAAFRVILRKRCHVLEPEPPLRLGTSGRVVTITRTPSILESPTLLAFTEDGMSHPLLDDGTLGASSPVPRPPPASPARLIWVGSSGQKLHHFFDDGLIHVQDNTGLTNLQLPDRGIVAGDARLQVSGIELGVVTTDEELALYLDRDEAWVFIPIPGILGSAETARIHMSRNSARVGLLGGDGVEWRLVERERPVVSGLVPGSGEPVYLRELDSSFRFHYVTSAGEVYAETASSFELLRKIDLGAQLAAAELSADPEQELYAVSVRGELFELRAGSDCPRVQLDLLPDGVLETFTNAAFVTGTDPDSGERLIQRIRISKP